MALCAHNIVFPALTQQTRATVFISGGDSPLATAAANGHNQICKKLLGSGVVDANGRDKSVSIPSLHCTVLLIAFTDMCIVWQSWAHHCIMPREPDTWKLCVLCLRMESTAIKRTKVSKRSRFTEGFTNSSYSCANVILVSVSVCRWRNAFTLCRWGRPLGGRSSSVSK